MAQGIKSFRFIFGNTAYEVHFGRSEGGYFYEIEDLGTFVTVDVKDGLSRDEFIGAVACALEPCQLMEFKQLVFSLG